MNLSEKKCVPCEGGVLPMPLARAEELLTELNNWSIVDGKLHKELLFKDFKEALAFVNKVGAIAEEQQHHPNITFTWGTVDITLYTHAIDGLSENDFVIAAKIDGVK